MPAPDSRLPGAPQDLEFATDLRQLVPAVRPVGRDDDLERITRWFSSGARLISLLGPPGCGKSRLALHAAADLNEQLHWPIIVLQLTALTDAHQIIPALTRSLHLAEDGRDPLERLGSTMRFLGPVLILLDNLEHIDGVAEIVGELLDAVPDLRILATSRVPLGIGLERKIELAPLQLPIAGESVGSLASSPAVALFLARAATSHATLVHADLPTVAKICRALDGLPLAIELAAAQLALTTLEELATLVESGSGQLAMANSNAQRRHTSLRMAIEISRSALDQVTQAAFDRLSIFVGGFDFESADRMVRCSSALTEYVPPLNFHVLTNGHPEMVIPVARLAPIGASTATVLQRLVEANLIQSRTGADGHVRYEMFASIRAFGIERLTATGELSPARTTHASAMVLFGWEASTALWSGRTQSDYWRRYDDEIGNLRAALEWTTGPDGADAFLAHGLAASIWFYLQIGGSANEARSWLDRATALPLSEGWLRAHTLNGLGYLAWTQGDLECAERAAREVVDDLALEINPVLVSSARFVLGLAAWRRGDIPVMHQELSIAKPGFAEFGDVNGVGFCDLALGTLARLSGDRETATALLDEALAMHEQGGHAWGAATARFFAGEVAHDGGDLASAARLIGDALDRYASQGDSFGAGTCIAGLAVLAAERGEAIRAARLFGAGFGLVERAGMLLPPVDIERYGAVAAELATRVPQAEFAIGRAWTYQEAIKQARDLAREVTENRIAGPIDDPVARFLKPVQLDAVNLICSGLSVEETAHRLLRSPKAIYSRLKEAQAKLGVNSIPELIVKVNNLRQPT